MADPNEIAYNFNEVEQLVKKLYEPGNAAGSVRSVQGELHKIQRSTQGWALADALLNSEDKNVRFFGALTFTTKVNNDWDSINEDQAVQLRERLTGALAHAVAVAEGPLIVKKLCSALSAYFYQSCLSWPKCLLDLINRLNSTSDSAPDTVGKADLKTAIRSAGQAQLLALLWFTTTLAEDGSKLDASRQRGHRKAESLLSQINDACDLIEAVLGSVSSTPPSLVSEALNCLQAWCVISSNAESHAPEISRLKQYISFAIKSLDNEELADEAAEFLIEILERNPGFLDKSQLQLLSTALVSPRSQATVRQMQHEPANEELYTFLNLLLGHADVILHEIVRAKDEASQELSQELFDLLNCDGTPGVDNTVTPMVLSFWTSYIEYLEYGDHDPSQNGAAVRSRVLGVIEACWRRIQWPLSQEPAKWDSDEAEAFNAFRIDVGELFQSAYMIIGYGLFAKFASMAIEAHRSSEWSQLEASLFALNALSDTSASSDALPHPEASNLFTSALFGPLDTCSPHIRQRIEKGRVRLLMNYSSFFEHHEESLLPIMNFLFASIANEELALLASKAILSISESCRRALVSKISVYLYQCNLLLRNPNSANEVTVRIVGATGAVIQILDSDDRKAQTLQSLLEDINFKLQRGIQAPDSGDDAAGALQCLASLGKSMQSPEVIDLEDTHDNPPESTYWTGGPGAQVQNVIVQMLVQAATGLRGNSEIIEALCQILRAGCNETDSGPFVLPANVAIDFVLSTDLNTARLEYVFETAGIMLVKQANAADPRNQQAAFAVLCHAKNLLRNDDDARSKDPDLLCGVIELMKKMVPRYVQSLLMLERHDSDLFRLALDALSALEVPLKRAATSFWASFVQKYELPDEVSTTLDGAIATFGPTLCRTLVFQIGGQAMRSQLDALADPLKKIVFHHPQRAKQWLAEALERPDFPSARIAPRDKVVWLQKIMNLRGARGTNGLVKDFWIQCMGPELGYT